MSHLTITPAPTPASHRTRRWAVSSQGHELGEVRWYAPWRRYAFYPVGGTLYDAACLAELAAFCQRQTEVRKAERTVERERERERALRSGG